MGLSNRFCIFRAETTLWRNVILFSIPILIVLYRYSYSSKSIYDKAQFGWFTTGMHHKFEDFEVMHRKKTRLYFCHIAKTGGTTLENVIVNFALDNHLHIARFEGKPYAFPWPSGDLESRLSKSVDLSRKLDIMYQHTVFNRSALHRVMHEDTIRVSLLRHPMAQLKSWFNFAGFHRSLGIHNSKTAVEEFLKNPARWDKVLNINDGNASMTKNFMASYFGLNTTFETSICADPTNLSACFISMIEENFDLILINEYYDESLLMLQDILRWNLEDILYLPLRKANYINKYKSTERYFMEQHKRWSPVDYSVYFHFKNKFQEQLKTLGRPFQIRTKLFKNILYRFRLFCADIIRYLWYFRQNRVDTSDILNHLKRFYTYSLGEIDHLKSVNITAVRCISLALDPVIVTKIVKIRYNSTLCTGKDEMFCTGTLLSGFLPLELFSVNSSYKWPLLFGNFVDSV